MQQSAYNIGHLAGAKAFQEASDFFKRTNVEIFRPEGKLIIELVKSGPLTMKQAMSVSECSYRGFYLMVERLVAGGVVDIHHSTQDRRVKTINIAHNVREELALIVVK